MGSLQSLERRAPGQEDQAACLGARVHPSLQGQGGQVLQRLEALSTTQVRAAAAVHVECPAGQEGQGIPSMGAASDLPNVTGTYDIQNQLLFKALFGFK